MENDLDMTGLKAAAVELHELYCTFKEAGFTEAEAIRLTETALTNALRA